MRNFGILLILILGSILPQVNAQVNFTFTGGTVSPGGTVDVDISVSNFTDIVLMQYSVNWDPGVLSFQSIQNVTNVLPQFTEDGNIGTPIVAQAVNDGELTVSWSLASTAPVSIPNGTRLFTIRLNVVGDECDQTNFTLSNNPRSIEVVDEDFNIVPVSVTPGIVDIEGTDCGGGGGGNLCDDTSDVALIANTRTAEQGTNVCLRVTAKNFTNIASIQTGFTWNSSVLSYTGIKESALTGISLNEANTGNGELRFLWIIGLGDNPISVQDDTELFQICFDLSGSNGQNSDVSFADLNNFDVEVANGNGQTEDVCLQNGKITIGSGGGGETCTGTTDVAMIGSSEKVANGNNVCIEVTTANFNNIASIQSGIAWNPSVLNYTGVTDRALTGISLNESNTGSGELRFLWIIGLGDDPLTLPDNTTLFDICFDGIGAAGQTSDISFVDLTNFDVEIANGAGQSEAICLESGQIEIEGGIGEPNLQLRAGSASVDQGQNVCIDIEVSNFTNVQSAQFNVLWDASILNFDQVKNINLPDFGSSNANFLTPNKLRVSWNPFNPTSVADNTSIFQICFDAVGDCNDQPTSPINFVSDANIQIEFSNASNNLIPFDLTSGSISIEACQSGFNVISITQPACNGEAGGSIIASVTGGIPPVTCVWKNSNGDVVSTSTTGCNLLGVVADTYTVEISDANGPVLTDMITIEEPAPLSTTGTKIDAGCGGSGSIDLSVSGGTPNYTYRWSPDQGNIQDPQNLVEGTYLVTVTDANNCEQTTSFQIQANTSALNIASFNVQNQNCSNPGGVDISVDGGCGPYSFAWQGPNGQTQNTEDISGVVPGSWSVTVTDNDSPQQSASMSFTVNDQISPLVGRLDSSTGVSCPDASDGVLDIGVSGGCSPYTYSWVGPDGYTSSGKDLNGLKTGDYSLTITDSSVPAKTSELSATVTQPLAIIVGSTVNQVTNMDGNNGSISLSISGGAPDYNVLWSDGNTSTERIGLVPGTYSVTVTDQNGCSQALSFTIEWNAIFAEGIVALNDGKVTCPGDANGIIDGVVVGGCGGTEIRLNGIAVTLPATNLQAGTYNVTVRDACGNEALKVITIEEPDAIQIDVLERICSNPGTGNGSATIGIFGGTGDYTITWSNGDVSADGFTSSNLPIGNVSVVVQDENGCQAAQLDIDIENCISTEPSECVERSIISPNNDGINDEFVFSCLSGNANQPNTLNVYDRWGRIVYTQDNYDNSWMGTDQKGNTLDEGGYMWILIIRNLDGSSRIEKGTLTLLRSSF